MIKYPKSIQKGRMDRLISLVDLAPTILSLAKINVPNYIQGKAFLGAENQKERDYVFGSADRFDEYYDRIRSIRDKEHLLVLNYYLNQPSYLDLEYRKDVPMMQNMLQLRDSGGLNEIQMKWFNPTKAEIEFYDDEADKDQVNNLANDPKYKSKIKKMLTELTKWQDEVQDKGGIAEAELLREQWPNFIQPKTKNPEVKNNEGTYYANAATPGADIVYRFSDSKKEIKEMDHWTIYQNGLPAEKGKFLHIKASRIGYADSETMVVK